MQLCAHIAQAQDGTHDELREHRLKGGVVQKAALGLGVAAVDVRDVGDALKYIEAHAERQGDAEKGKVGIRQSAQIFQKPTHVLEIKETAHIARERKDEPGAPLIAVRVLDQPPCGKVDENEREQHEKRARTRAEPIEEQAPQCEPRRCGSGQGQYSIPPERRAENKRETVRSKSSRWMLLQ